MLRKTLLVAAVISAGGCTADLAVYKADETRAKGVPVRTAEVYAVVGNYTRHKEGIGCDASPFPTKFVSLPTGALYFIDPDTGALADSEFSLSFSDAGLLTGVTLNSESKATDTLESVAGFLTSAGIFAPAAAAATAAAAAETMEFAPGVSPPCDTGEEVTRVATLVDFINRPQG